MLPPIEFVYWLDDISSLMSLDPKSKAYKETFKALKKELEITPARFDLESKRWNRIFTVSTAISALLFFALILLAAFGRSGEPRLFSNTEALLVQGGGVLFLLSDAVSIIAYLKSNRIDDNILQTSIDNIWRRMQMLSPDAIRHALAVYHNDMSIETFETPSISEELCGCYFCRKIFPAKAFQWNHDPDYPLCPHCLSEKHLVYGSKKAALTFESLSTLHALFIEEN